MQEHAVILLVDDCDDDIVLVRKAFERGHLPNPIHVVRSGEEAIAFLMGEKQYANRQEYPLPDLILLDLKMPKIDGFEVLSWIRNQPGIRGIAVVVLTSSDQIRDVNKAYALGANSFLVKPVDFNNYVELGKLIREYWMKTVRVPETFRPPPVPDDTGR
jgi:CheY-like chemotaxis protein